MKYALKATNLNKYYAGTSKYMFDKNNPTYVEEVENSFLIDDYNQAKGLMVMLYSQGCKHELAIVTVESSVVKEEPLSKKDLYMLK